MNSLAAISNQLPPANNKSRMEKHDALNSDIIAAIEKNFPAARAQVANVAEQFRGSDALNTASNVWSFLRNQLTYTQDPQSHQMVRLPSRLVKDGIGDCKSYSLFAAAILSALGMPVAFRYASYTSSSIPTHVYVVTEDEAGREIIVDGVWSRFDSEKRYTHKKDHLMQVLTLSGIGGKKERKARQDKRKERRKTEGGFFKRAGKAVKKVGLAPGRAAFLLLVDINAHGFATKLANALKKNPTRTKTMWEKLGGKFDKLQAAITRGANKKKILGIGYLEEFYGLESIYGINGIGSAVAAAAAAAPIIITIVKFLKGEGEGDPELESALKEASGVLEASGGEELPNNLSELDVTDADPGVPRSGSGNTKWFLIGGAALVLVGGAIYLKKSKRK